MTYIPLRAGLHGGLPPGRRTLRPARVGRGASALRADGVHGGPPAPRPARGSQLLSLQVEHFK